MIFKKEQLINLIVELTLNINHAKANVGLDKTELIYLITKDLKRAIRQLSDKQRAEILMLIQRDEFKRSNDLY